MSVKEITQRSETDFVWYDKPMNHTHLLEIGMASPTSTLLVFNQGESGFSSMIAGMGLVGEEEYICKIYSKLHNINAYNTVPNPTFPEWRLYRKFNQNGDRFFILRITNSHILPQHNSKTDNCWIYTYPIIRDIVLELNQFNIDELIYLTTNLIPLDTETDVSVFDYLEKHESPITLKGKEMQDEVILGSIGWSFASIFKDFCIPHSGVDISGVWVVIGNSGHNFIDTETSSKFLDFCFTSYELNHNDEKVAEVVEILEDLEHLSDHFDFGKGGKNYE